MNKRKACIVAAGVSDFGVRQAHIVDLFQEAAKRCLDDIPGLKPKDIDALLVATSLSGRTSTQINTAPVVAERLGLKPTSLCTRIDTLCAGGNSGILIATALVESGMADVVMVTGAEKLYTPQRWEVFYSELNVVDHDWDGAQALGLPPPFEWWWKAQSLRAIPIMVDNIELTVKYFPPLGCIKLLSTGNHHHISHSTFHKGCGNKNT